MKRKDDLYHIALTLQRTFADLDPYGFCDVMEYGETCEKACRRLAREDAAKGVDNVREGIEYLQQWVEDDKAKEFYPRVNALKRRMENLTLKAC